MSIVVLHVFQYLSLDPRGGKYENIKCIVCGKERHGR